MTPKFKGSNFEINLETNKLHVPKIDLNKVREQVRLSPLSKHRRRNNNLMGGSVPKSRAGKRISVINSQNIVFGKSPEFPYKGRSQTPLLAKSPRIGSKAS